MEGSILLGDDEGIGQDWGGRSKARELGVNRTRSDLRGKALLRKDRELGEVGVPSILAAPHQSGGKLDMEAMRRR